MFFRGAERRLRTRFRARLPFVLKSNGQSVRGTTRNISLLGISAYTDSPLPVVQSVECQLELPRGAAPLSVNGTVIRCQPLPTPHPDGPYEVGVFFKEFQEKGGTALLQFLEKVEKQEEAAIREGYRELKQRISARRRRKRLKAQRKLRRRLARLKRKQKRLAQQKRLARKKKLARAKKRAASSAKKSSRKSS